MQQATDDQIRELVLAPMTAYFAPHRDCADPTAAIGVYLPLLRRFPPPILAAGWERVVASHGRLTWPLPKQIVDACATVLAEQRATARAAAPDASTRLRQLADRVMLEPLGIQARAEGWSRQLHTAIAHHGPKDDYPIETWRGAVATRRRWAAGELTPEEREMRNAELWVGVARALEAAEQRHAARFADGAGGL